MLPLAFFSQTIILRNVNLIPVNHDITIKDCNVFIRNGIIEKITPYPELKEPGKRAKKKEPTAGYTVIDCGGKFLIPGLADMHAHFPEKNDPVSLQDYLKLDLAAGVTEVRSMRGTKEELPLRDSILKNLKKASPEIFVSYVFPYKDSVLTQPEVEKLVTSAKASNYNFVKYLGGLNKATFALLQQSCKANGIALSGHAYQNDLQACIQAGYASVEHYQALLSAYKRDSTGFKNTLDTLKKYKVAYCPTLSFYNIYALRFSERDLLSRNGMAYLNNSKVKEEWLNTYHDDLKQLKEKYKDEFDAKYVAPSQASLLKFNAVLKAAADAGVCILLSPDDGIFNVPGFGMYEEMKLYKEAGLSNYQILKCATLNAAICLKEQKSWGSIEIGKKANLVLLNSNPLENIEAVKDVEATIVHGKYYPQKETLDQLKLNK